ncbi:tetratricopeptide repeat protein [Flavobacteriaceae bacterium D16]|nr:tetratricopeptide repeat protein [Flavobacteriaceae bacterium D16]
MNPIVKMYLFLKLCLVFLFIGVRAEAQSTASTVADSLYVTGNYTQAINEYATNGTEQAKLQIARSYNAIGNFGKAIIQYEDIVQKNEDNALAKYELGKLYFKVNQPQKSAALFFDLVTSGGQNPEYHYYFGRSLFALNSISEGVMAYKSAIELDSVHIKSIFQLAKFYLMTAKNDSVIKYADMGLKGYQEDVSMLNLKTQAYFNKEQHKMAIRIFERLLELGEDKPHIHKKVGYSYFRELELEKAKKSYRKLLETPNEEGDAYFGLGEIYLKEKVLDSAEIYFKKSIEAKRVYFDQEYANLGRTARLQNKTKKALDYYIKAWEENKRNLFYYYQVCILADEYYQDPKTKLNYYENLFEYHDKVMPFIAERAKKRIRELKEEIHFKD